MRNNQAGVERLHDVVFDSRPARVERTALHRCLHPERRPPSRLLLKAATAFVVAVAMHELRPRALRERPESLAGVSMRYVPHNLARLELGRDELSVGTLDELHPEKTVLHLNGVVLRRREPMRAPSPEVGTVAPLRLVQLIAVELVVPHELELSPARQKGRLAPFQRHDALACDGKVFKRMRFLRGLRAVIRRGERLRRADTGTHRAKNNHRWKHVLSFHFISLPAIIP